MKLFSRKALLAVATATAVTTGAMTAPTAMAEQSSAAATTQQSAAASTSPSESEDANSGSGELRGMSRDEKTGKVSAKKIGEWIGVIGTILTVITSVITFMGKIPNFNFGR
ncbi:MAG: hypothetical protein ACFNL4_08030 [Corynebacterium matruchotii]|jgi:hypothetical protein|uniref:Tat pathway signal sequence domain protein n=1 Tax=Corynebacterium matruchotii ATCC 33806 TaxID=566549 RepID=C0E2W8_9CORY|nr:hypothetical protein [Corynebacterium matruchotii]EEG27253.1 hypothetical protein CORMATOL_01330 [Corynebacterium matruchotii ATCC 33806]RKW20873.1 MAG: hypothetical protein D8B53_08635 [Corynebacterium sp.]VEI99346.1 Uncharacterised protein [Corynebacterium matruchotii]